MENHKTIELNELLIEFISIQTKLVKTSQQIFIEVQDWENLLDFPCTGSIPVGDKTWDFRRHGIGVCFTEQKSKVVVDINKHFLFPWLFNLWRLEIYLNSIKWKPIDKPTSLSRSHQLDNIKSLLHQMLDEGTLQESSEFPQYFLLMSEIEINGHSLE